MNAALLLVDLQEDYLRAPGLAPDRDLLVARAGELLDACRRRDFLVAHALTTVSADGHDRMPHWKADDRWLCVTGTPGHAPPSPLVPAPGEVVVHKRHYSGFESGELGEELRRRDIDTLLVAGLHLHACVRATVLDALRHGLDVCVVEDATATDDPLHAAATHRYLADRGVRFASRHTVGHRTREPAFAEHVSPRDGTPRGRFPIAGRREVSAAAERARRAGDGWRRASAGARARHLIALADALEADAAAFAETLVHDVGKPVGEARGEVSRTTELLRLVAGTADRIARDVEERSEGTARRRPLGVVGMITPWNNPLAIPLGKIAPALLYGNTVVWKPAPAGAGIADRFMNLVGGGGLPEGVMCVVHGGRATAREVMRDPSVAAVTLSGSSAAGFAAQEVCARRRIPLQAELGGNNAAIVWSDTDLHRAAREIASGAFGFAGQRCTANRRAVIDASVYDEFVAAVIEATGALGWGDPMRDDVAVGPVISRAKRDELTALIARADEEGAVIFRHASPLGLDDGLEETGTYVPPTILSVPDPTYPLVQEESFGPLLVLQRAGEWDEALELLNGVPQGLVAALFSESTDRREAFCERAEAGILKIDQATHGAGIDLPFGGWKQSGVGPPEHGPGNREFYTRAQAVYVNEDEA